MTIVYEGFTEEKVIDMILKALYVDPQRDGLFLYNAAGQKNIEARIDSICRMARENGSDVFLVVDNDRSSDELISSLIRKGCIRESMFHRWRKDFEYDNFGTDIVIDRVNNLLRGINLNTISVPDVEKRMSHS